MPVIKVKDKESFGYAGSPHHEPASHGIPVYGIHLVAHKFKTLRAETKKKEEEEEETGE